MSTQVHLFTADKNRPSFYPGSPLKETLDFTNKQQQHHQQQIHQHPQQHLHLRLY